MTHSESHERRMLKTCVNMYYVEHLETLRIKEDIRTRAKIGEGNKTM